MKLLGEMLATVNTFDGAWRDAREGQLARQRDPFGSGKFLPASHNVDPHPGEGLAAQNAMHREPPAGIGGPE